MNSINHLLQQENTSDYWDYDYDLTSTIRKYHESPRELETMEIEPPCWKPNKHALDLRPTHSKIRKLCRYIKDLAKEKEYLYYHDNWDFGIRSKKKGKLNYNTL